MTKKELTDLLEEIKNDEDSCFNVDLIKEHDGFLFEKCEIDDCKYRSIFSHDDYDYVEDPATIAELDKLFA